MVNWTDHGAIPVAKTNTQNPITKWANNAWAPDAAWKNINGKDKFFLYFANNGSGIGVITADNPTFQNAVDPIGKELISRSTPNSNVTWLFDPGVYYDEASGEAYIAYGGAIKIATSQTGPAVAYIDVPAGGLTEVEMPVIGELSGTTDLYFIFTDGVEFDWWQFS